MSYLQELVSAADTPASAYLQFITEKDREAYVAFAFVEDEDDIRFYQHVLVHWKSICYFGCGGKNGVFEVFRRLTKEGRADGNLFMVDRDVEQPPYLHADEMLRTSLYSWEAHLCAPGIFSVCVQRRTKPNLSGPQCGTLEAKMLATFEAFREAFVLHAAMLNFRRFTNVPLGLGDVRFSQGCYSESGVLLPSANLINELAAKVEEAGFDMVTLAQLAVEREVLNETPVLQFARGKTLFQVIRAFLEEVASHLGVALRDRINSPLQILATTRWDHPDFDYIREYADRRISVMAPALLIPG